MAGLAERGKARRIVSDEEAVAVARELAADFAREAAERDRERRLPAAELDRFSGAGLWAITVPKEHGGAGVSFATLGEVIATISAGDPSVGQIPQKHLAALDAIRGVREKLFGAGSRLSDTHPGSRYRDLAAVAQPALDAAE